MLDHIQKSQEGLEIADKTMEKTLFWGMLFTFVMVVFGMVQGMPG